MRQHLLRRFQLPNTAIEVPCDAFRGPGVPRATDGTGSPSGNRLVLVSGSTAPLQELRVQLTGPVHLVEGGLGVQSLILG